MTIICTVCELEKPKTEFYERGDRPFIKKSECKTCFKDRMFKRNDNAKRTLVAEAGGCCCHCGYSKDARVLTFHHIDPLTKKFGIAQKLSSPLSRLREEAAKCILLCPNCHAEKHLGLW